MKYLLYYMCPNTKKNQSERKLTKHRIIQSQHNYLFLKNGIPLQHSRTAILKYLILIALPFFVQWLNHYELLLQFWS